jgi:hypothetical protein
MKMTVTGQRGSSPPARRNFTSAIIQSREKPVAAAAVPMGIASRTNSG